ncbi:MAG: hypothetical protein MZV64_70675 [Ignavibacteriales bacterium]|nr:hypothetical protein [Ignavibacteriales bacterium]
MLVEEAAAGRPGRGRLAGSYPRPQQSRGSDATGVLLLCFQIHASRI